MYQLIMKLVWWDGIYFLVVPNCLLRGLISTEYIRQMRNEAKFSGILLECPSLGEGTL